MARTFNGSTQYATAPANALFNPTDLSVSVWVKMNAGAGGIDHIMGVGGDTTGGVLDGWGLEANTFNGHAGIVWDADAYATQIGSNSPYTNDVWVHLGMELRLTTSELNRFYADGVQVGADLTAGGRAANAQVLRIAVNPNLDGNHLFAEVAHPAIYNGILSGANWAALAAGANPLAVNAANLNAYWPMDGSGATEIDVVSGLTLTYVGSPGVGTAPAVDDPPAPDIVVVTGQVSEANTSLEIGSAKNRMLGALVELDVAQTLSATKAKALEQVLENNFSQSLSSSAVRTAGQVSESDVAIAIAKIKAREIFPVAEYFQAATIPAEKAIVLGLVTESDVSQALESMTVVSTGTVLETSTAQAVAATKARLLGQTIETSLAISVNSGFARLVGLVDEVSQAEALLAAKAKTVSQVSETDFANAAFSGSGQQVGRVSEIDLAQFIQKAKSKPLSPVGELNTSIGVFSGSAKQTGQVSEASLAQPLSVMGSQPVGMVFETDGALAIGYPRNIAVGHVTESDLAMAVTIPGISGAAARIQLTGVFKPTQSLTGVWLS